MNRFVLLPYDMFLSLLAVPMTAPATDYADIEARILAAERATVQELNRFVGEPGGYRFHSDYYGPAPFHDIEAYSDSYRRDYGNVSPGVSPRLDHAPATAGRCQPLSDARARRRAPRARVAHGGREDYG